MTAMTAGGATGDGADAIREWIAANIGGAITRFEPIARWRQAWEVDVDRGGEQLRLHVRGERGSGLDNRPLRREFDALGHLAASGIPVPRLFGWCDNPRAIIMENLADTPFLGNLDGDPQLQSMVEDYAAIMADIHRLDPAPFAAMGIEAPVGAEAVATEYLEFAEGIYDETPHPPNALIAFCRGWLRRHLPLHRERLAPVIGDAPQFFHDGGRVTAIYDLELVKLADPMLDIASIRLRDTNEPIADVEAVLARYEREMGEPLDQAALSYYTVLLFIAVPMISTPALAPRPHPALVEYLSWFLASSRGAIEAVAEAKGIALDPVEKVEKASTVHDGAFEDLVAQCADLQPSGFIRQAPALALAYYVRNANALAAPIDAADRADARALLGIDADPAVNLDSILEDFVVQASPEQDEALVRLFHRRAMRQLQLLEDYPAPIVNRGLQPLRRRR
ncbi:aminoglycoside phosphotransferase (APT) family kinase protein [Sphingobium fontiphilum]|uniref:Aminoglycoside phosphotransferase (APT) family kinase protein n=1 Tax=Sphingobium fontiphilum TaxID=944425 RepID=A0A7W6DKD9_9SPHN|nr:phosphotransferase [Sphingobium fontiphilum]MBB3982275.1 aminoglycoside phosphotransferase (APT) family kinase protein [Sphingobium fontiphilum]